MNFVRSFEPRDKNIELNLLDTTIKQMKLINEMNVPATFLLQYDVLCNEEYMRRIFAEAKDNIEFGFWYEIVEPLTTACGLPYESKNGYKWDWNIKPGFSMSYPKNLRIVLIDEAMRKFKEIFGYYPTVIGSWIFDTHTVKHLAENYNIDGIWFCRDQINTDAYTLVGGYFNQAYYPSKNNFFTPAQNPDEQLDVPVFRLLGPDPIHNYDGEKYRPEGSMPSVYTMELVHDKTAGGSKEVTDWYIRSYFDNESLGFAYMQIGQENSFCNFDIITPLRYQITKILEHGDVKLEKMSVTAKAFKDKYNETPATCVCALDNWEDVDVQSVYFDSKNYTANIFRHNNKVFIRSLYLFDERIKDAYNECECKTFDAVYENMPIVDTIYQKGGSDGGVGIVLDTNATPFDVKKISKDSIKIFWDNKSVTFTPDNIIINNCKLYFAPCMINTKISVTDTDLNYEYKNNVYGLNIKNGVFCKTNNAIVCNDTSIILTPKRIGKEF